MFERIGRNTYELSGNDLHKEFLQEAHKLREVQEDRKDITTYGFLTGVFSSGTIGTLAIFAPQKIREQVRKLLELKENDSIATGLATAGIITAGSALGTAVARATATKYVDQVYDSIQNRIEVNKMLHQDISLGIRQVVEKLMQTHVILVKSGETPSVIFKPLNWFQKLVIKVQKTRLGKTGLIPARRRLNLSAKN